MTKNSAMTKANREFFEKVASSAVSEGLVDAVYTEFDSPIGHLVLVQTDRGICRLAFEGESLDNILDQVAESLGPRVVASKEETRGVREVLGDYFEGQNVDLDLPLDWRLVRTDFHRRVLRGLLKVPRGKVATYAALAARIGSPRAVRATGTALGRNPIPVIVPCHRIVPSSGGVGNYGGGPDLKRWLLELEGAEVS